MWDSECQDEFGLVLYRKWGGGLSREGVECNFEKGIVCKIAAFYK